MTRSVIRHATWTITPDLTEGASPPLFELECTTCPEKSPACEDASEAQQWALEHSGRHPTHTGFRGIHTSFWRTTMTDQPTAPAPLIGRPDAAPIIPSGGAA